jgi:hypothetical protein
VSSGCIAEQLEISRKEWEASAEQVNYMIKAREAGPLTEIQISKIFEEWVTIAKRLKKGASMLRQTERQILEETTPALEKRLKALTNLYSYLLKILGLYDLYLRLTIDRDHHKRLQMAVLQLLE